MRSMWKGAISFGLVMIPVRLYAATEQKDITFRQVHRADGGRIRFHRVCSIDGEEVPYEDVAKGYELPNGEMVILTDEDMAELPLPTSRSIEVLHFTPAEQLDPILYNRSYYAEPEAAGARAYVLLRDALESSGKVAIAQVALRQRESLATLRSRDGVLVLETLLWPDEVRAAAFPFLDDDIDVRSQELQMAASLIDSMTVDLDPTEYHDHYREALAELVSAKAEGRDVTVPEEAEDTGAEVTSLADALKASLAAAREGPAGSGSKPGESGSATKRTTRAGGKGGAAKAPGTGAAAKTGTRTASGRGSSSKESASGSAAKSGERTRPRRAATAKQASAPKAKGTAAEREPASPRRTRRKAS
jgi:DNA end-binding protein Ku